MPDDGFKSDEGRVSHAPSHTELNLRLFHMAYIGPGYKGQPPSRVKVFFTIRKFIN